MAGDRGAWWARVNEVLDRVLERAPECREAFLREVCRDESVRKEVGALLREMEAADEREFMAQPVLGGMPVSDDRASDPYGLIGETLLRYEVLDYLGGGGMGVVYEARDNRLGRTVALKLLHPHLSVDSASQRRFVSEARTASALDHPGICTIYDIGETAAGQTFIAMACYEGETLRAKIGRGPLPIGEAVGYAIQIAEGLARAHEAGIVHRDVKPGNVMVTPGGRVKMLDFGIATMHPVSGADEPDDFAAARAQRQQAVTRARRGTAAYMSPEQVSGDSVDARSDLWALGVVLYEMLTGTHPFEAPDEQRVARKIQEGELLPVRAVRGAIPEALARITERLLQKESDLRYQTASDVISDLEEAELTGTRAAFRWKGTAAWLALATLVLALTMAVAVTSWVGLGGWSDRPVPEAGAVERLDPDPHSVAVLPFTYEGAPDSTDYFSLGMTDEVLTALSKIRGLLVTARASVMPYRETEQPIPEIGRELGVAHVLEGSVQHADGRVRIHVRLLDARTGEYLWAKRYMRPVEAVMQVQGEIASAVAREIEVELSAETELQLADASGVDSAAYMLYLQGKHLRYQETGTSFREAVRLLQASIAADSTFAPAWAMLSTSIWLASLYAEYSPPGVSVDTLVFRAARRALALDSLSAEVHVAMGLFYVADRDFKSAGPWLRRATEINPGLAHAQREYGLYLIYMGALERADRHLRRAVRLDPASPNTWWDLGMSDFFRGDYEEAKYHLERSLVLQPSYWPARLGLGEVHLAQDRPRAALREMRRAVETNTSPTSLAWLGRAYALTGYPDSARAVLKRMHDSFGSSPARESIIYTALGETDRALSLLEEENGHTHMKVAPWWDPIRDTPRYQRLLKEMGFAE